MAPQTWHYGLVAKWWAEFNEGGPELAYFRRFIEGDGQPALDVACGTGRLLLPYLHAGLDVDGCDVSEDMIELCRERAEREGLSPTLFVQSMHQLDPPRSYRTIVVCGGFALGSDRAQDFQALERFYEHLEPGGTLVLDNEVPYADAQLWQYWLEEKRAELPREWRAEGDRRVGSDGTEYELRSRVASFDPLSQRATVEMKAAIWRDGERIVEEDHVLQMTLYFTHEVELMLRATGFVEILLRAGYEDRSPTSEDDFVVFVAKKPLA